MFSRRQSSAIEYSPRRPERTTRIFSSVEYLFRVTRRMFLICCSAVSGGPDFWLIFTPLMGYDEPESSEFIPSNVPRLLTADSAVDATRRRDRTLFRRVGERHRRGPARERAILCQPGGPAHRSAQSRRTADNQGAPGLAPAGYRPQGSRAAALCTGERGAMSFEDRHHTRAQTHPDHTD